MNAIPCPLPESPNNRRARQLDYFRRVAEKAMRAVDIASEQLEVAHATGEPGATASPTLDLARATRALVLAVNAENAVVDGVAAPRARADDPRRPILREALHKAADAEPDRRRRGQLRHDVDDRIEDTLVGDPDGEIPLPTHLCAIVDELGLTLDLATLSDAVMGMPPWRRPPHHTQPDPATAPFATGQPASADTGDPWDEP